MSDHRIDELSGARVVVTGSRQHRPNRPGVAACPFCVGGLEAPEPYEVKAFPNRWPSYPDGRSEVVLYSPTHDAALWQLGVGQVRKVIDAVRANKISVVFSESTISPDPAKQVARETGAKYGGVLYVDSLSAADGKVPTYIDLLRVTSETIANGLAQ